MQSGRSEPLAAANGHLARDKLGVLSFPHLAPDKRHMVGHVSESLVFVRLRFDRRSLTHLPQHGLFSARSLVIRISTPNSRAFASIRLAISTVFPITTNSNLF